MDILKIIGLLVAILLLIRLRVPLFLTFLGSAAALGLLFHMDLPRLALAFFNGSFAEENLLLIVSFLLILFFSAIMKETGSMPRAIADLQGIFHDDRATVAVIPALIGLLPIQGGAILSAPMVAEASDNLKLNPERRTFLNYWFRHVWEYILPTHPIMILTTSITGVPVAKIVLANFPLTLAAIAMGLIFGFKGIPRSTIHSSSRTFARILNYLASFCANLLPFFLILFLVIGFKVHIAYAMVPSIIGLILYYRLPPGAVWRLAKASFSLDMVLIVWGVMVFKEVIEASGAMNSFSAELARMGLPSWVLVVSLPAILALITGFPPAFIGLSFPLLLPIIQASDHSIYYIMLALTSALCTHLFSPMHACLVMTREYYHADLNKVYRMLLLPASLVFLTGVTLFAIGVMFF